MIQPRIGIEVAVPAPVGAERYVNIQTELVQHVPRTRQRGQYEGVASLHPHEGVASLHPRHAHFSSTRNARMNTSGGTSTSPRRFIFSLPFFCFSRSLRLRVTSPP